MADEVSAGWVVRSCSVLAHSEATALPVAEELKFAAIKAIWDNQSWRTATWLGVPVARYPTDLHAYQELTVQTRPEAVVLLGGLAALAVHLKNRR